MKRLMLSLLAAVLAGALPCLTAPVAAAGEVGLRWDECGAMGSRDNSFACAGNAATHLLVSSFVAPPNITRFVGASTEVLVVASSSGLPPWWHAEGGGCRAGVVTSEDALATALAGCRNPFEGSQNISLANVEANYLGNASRARIIADLARTDDGIPLDPGVEYQANVIQIRSTRTTGAGSCAGCADPVCVVLSKVWVAQTAGTPGDTYIQMTGYQPAWVTWRGGAIGDALPCTGSNSSRNTTWGGLKSLYR